MKRFEVRFIDRFVVDADDEDGASEEAARMQFAGVCGHSDVEVRELDDTPGEGEEDRREHCARVRLMEAR